MLNDSILGDVFYVQTMEILVHIHNKGMIRSNSDTAPYELWKGRLTNIKCFRILEIKCYIKMEDNKIGKFYSHVNEGIFIGYSHKIKAYKCYNLRLNKIVESINVTIEEVHGKKARKGGSSLRE